MRSATRAGSEEGRQFSQASFNEKTDYSGFDRDSWPPRHNSSHCAHAEMVRKASTQSRHEALASKYGVYYSCLLQLEYFDAVRFTVIDPMHNLFLGTAKHVFKLWVKNNLLTKKDLKALREHNHLFNVGKEVGRLPHRIASNYCGYIASQWKNWTLIYSVLSERPVTREPFEVLADICSCLQVTLYAISVKD